MCTLQGYGILNISEKKLFLFPVTEVKNTIVTHALQPWASLDMIQLMCMWDLSLMSIMCPLSSQLPRTKFERKAVTVQRFSHPA